MNRSNLASEAEPSSADLPPVASGQRLILYNVGWEEYVAIGDALRERPSPRLTYDQGTLEFLTTSYRHEWLKKRIGGLFVAMAEQTGLAIAPGGSTTFQRPDLGRAFEPDECFWIAHERQMRTCMEWDPERCPPPDLILEVEVMRSALDRMSIFAAFGVPEVWCCDPERVRVFRRGRGGAYKKVSRSVYLPGLPVEEVARFLKLDPTRDYIATMRACRKWVRETQKRGGHGRKPRGVE